MKQGQGRNSQKRRTPWFVLILFAVIVATVAGVSLMVLRSARSTLFVDVERSLTAQAQLRLSELTVWSGALKSQISALAETDMFRLYASEIDGLGNKFPRFIKLADKYQKVTDMSEVDEEGALAAMSSGDDVNTLASRLPIVRSVLEKFLERSGFVAVRLLTSGGQVYLTAGDAPQELAPEQTAAIRAVMEKKQVKVLPTRLSAAGRLLMDVAQPLAAPTYVTESGSPVGVMLVSCDVTRAVDEATFHAAAGHAQESGHILQWDGERLEVLMPANSSGGRHELVDWKLVGEELLFGERSLTVGDAQRGVYAMGLKATGLPWYVEQDISLEQVEQRWAEHKRMVVLAACAAGVIASLLLGMVWWWLVGRRERAVSAELRELYLTVNEQKQLLAGINGTLADGIVLEDAKGRIRYANEAFAAMVETEPQNVIGRTAAELMGTEAAHCVRCHTGRVLNSSSSVTFAETFSLPSGKRHYQVACSPFEEDGATSGVVSVYRDITELLEAQQRAQRMVSQTVDVLVRSIEAVDPYLRGQSSQSGKLAVFLAGELQLSQEHADTLRTAANLSQVGMIQLPRELLTKSDTLTPEERVLLERHVGYARSALQGIDFGLPVLEAICQMHERLDGSGYPEHLRGDDIGIDARILAVANTFCALVRPRSYRQARSIEAALEILSATPPRYAPDVVEALTRFLQTSAGRSFLASLLEQGD